MSTLKLVKNEKNKFHFPSHDTENDIIEKLGPEELTLYQELKKFSAFFKNKKTSNKNEDYSKFFLIFSLNYFNLGLNNHARDMLQEIDPIYFKDQLILDMEKAMVHRNKAHEFERKRKMDEAREHWKEAEFFVVVIKALPFLAKEEWLYSHPHYKEFLNKLNKSTFNLKLAPKMQILK